MPSASAASAPRGRGVIREDRTMCDHCVIENVKARMLSRRAMLGTGLGAAARGPARARPRRPPAPPRTGRRRT